MDENHLPVKIQWEAPDSGEKSEAKSIMLTLWDANENNTLRIDLWTKEMMMDEMADFIYQNMMTMADSFERATKQEDLARDMKTFAKAFLKKFQQNMEKSAQNPQP